MDIPLSFNLTNLYLKNFSTVFGWQTIVSCWCNGANLKLWCIRDKFRYRIAEFRLRIGRFFVHFYFHESCSNFNFRLFICTNYQQFYAQRIIRHQHMFDKPLAFNLKMLLSQKCNKILAFIMAGKIF